MIDKFITCFLVLPLCSYATYYSQPYCNQDQYVYEHYFKDYRNGTFVDIGAHDGITYSNTYFFEKEMGWKGLCIEPMPERFLQLQSLRTSTCIRGCVSDIEGPSKLLLVKSRHVDTEMLSGLLHKYHPLHLKRVIRQIKRYKGSYQILDVECYLLNSLLEKEGIRHVNFLSLDTEGGEFDILASIDFSKYTIDVIAVEDNYSDPRLITLLTEKGYTLASHLYQDLLFVRNDFLPKN